MKPDSGTKTCFFFCFAASIFCFAPWGLAEPNDSPDWSQWRGPARDGQVAGAAWPDQLVEGSLERVWRMPLGPSYSGPIVTEDLVFTTATEEKESEVVYALDRKTGEERWRTSWPGAMKVPFFAKSNGSWIRSTPAYDGSCLYVAGMRDLLVCLNADSGTMKWEIDFMATFQTPLPSFGFVCSPLVDGDAVYVQSGASVVKLDKATGEVLWRVLEEDGGMNDSAFSSPVIATVSGIRQLLVQGREALAGVELESGTVLWKKTVPAFRGMNILTPVVHDDAIFTSSYKNESWLYQITRSENEWSVATAWTNNAAGYMSSPVVVDGHAYLHLQNERFTCIDLQTGERTWTSKPFAKYASLVAQGDRILALTADGHLLLMKANPAAFELIGAQQISEQDTWAHLGLSGDQLFVRELNAIAAFRWVDPAP